MNECVEITTIKVKNTGKKPISFIPTAAYPLYGRSAENIRDHRQVTSLLHRVALTEKTITLTPTLLFNEEGHKRCKSVYTASFSCDDGSAPVGFCPITQDYLGENGSYDYPEAVIFSACNTHHAGDKAEGYEVCASAQFPEVTLLPDEEKSFFVVIGIDTDTEKFLDSDIIHRLLLDNKSYWQSKTMNIHMEENYDRWIKWVSIQPVMRRIFGCSFLPHHDYGKGGRGWRDLWQDCLALILTEPQTIRNTLLNNFGGVRIDGTNATIIGSEAGEFKADRNRIVRVWSDHGMWPLLTVDLYLQQTGDYDFLMSDQVYFRDNRLHRCEEIDPEYSKDKSVLTGTVIEHIIIQNATAFFDIGEHGFLRLRGADWNDGLDMAEKNGETVAFTAAYCHNYGLIMSQLEQLKERGVFKLRIPSPLAELLRFNGKDYPSFDKRRAALREYCSVTNSLFLYEKMDVGEIAECFDNMRCYWGKLINSTEIVNDGVDLSCYNSYYDDNSRQVEGVFDDNVRMMLTGQVFCIMSDISSEQQTKNIIRAADWYLYAPDRGGYFLNTDFKEVKTDLGRMFGFAFGHKENGAVFSHMAVMYAYSLYSRGFAAEGDKVLTALYKQSADYKKSRIYPGIPEYFDINGRGMYPYLTGAASWYILTLQTQVFGVRGSGGNLLLEPKLTANRFDKSGKTAIHVKFAERSLCIEYLNVKRLDYKDYTIITATIDDNELECESDKVLIQRSLVSELDPSQEHIITLTLG